MREISSRKRMEVLKLYFMGCSYDDIAKNEGVSKGSVVNVVRELKEGKYGEFDDVYELVDELRELSVSLRKSGPGVFDALLGLTFYKRLLELGVEPSELELWIRLCKKLSTPDESAGKIVKATITLLKMEDKLDKTYEEIIQDYSDKVENLKKLEVRKMELEAGIGGLKDQADKMKKRLDDLTQEMNHSLANRERIQRLGLEKLERLAKFIDEYEALNYCAEEVNDVAGLKESLIKMGINPAEVAQHAEELATIQERVSKLKGVAKLEEERLKLLRGRCKTLQAYEADLQMGLTKTSALTTVLKERRVFLPCKLCQALGSIEIKLWNHRALMDAAAQNLMIRARCSRCGNWIYYSVWEILVNLSLLLMPE